MQLADNPDKFAKALTGIYATAPHYGETLVSVMRQYNLYQYDVAPLAAPAGIESPADGRLVAVVSSSVHGIAQLGTMAGILSFFAAISVALHHPALGAFLSDSDTAATLTTLLTGLGALGAGIMRTKFIAA
jgi:hypothetical protein